MMLSWKDRAFTLQAEGLDINWWTTWKEANTAHIMSWQEAMKLLARVPEGLHIRLGSLIEQTKRLEEFFVFLGKLWRFGTNFGGFVFIFAKF